MPAEWEEQECVWFSWPLNPTTWHGRLPAIRRAFAEAIAPLTGFEPVRIICAGSAQAEAERILQAAGADLGLIEYFDIPTDDVWCRDHGPTFVRRLGTGNVEIIDWCYNAWGGKFPPWDKDDAVPARVAEALEMPRRRVDLVCEGGALEVNGEGLLMTTESVLLNPNRNPGRSRREVEAILMGVLGVERILWLNRGMDTDDTDGHIDTLARFWKRDGVAAPRAPVGHPDHHVLEENWERLQDLRTPAGGHFDMAALPHPNPVVADGARHERLPATYANFLIVNGAVLVPTYGQGQQDQAACGLIGELFSDREIIDRDSSMILWEGGSFHCLSQQQPGGGLGG